MRHGLRLVLASALLAAALPAASDPIVVGATVPYDENADIPQKIRTECADLNQKFADFIRSYATQDGVSVTTGDTAAGNGRVLRVWITAASSQGNAWIGHHKSTSARGALYENGKPVASFRATRNSMGGMFAGYKGSCSVLGRTVEAMGRDIATWLKNPVDGAELGDR